MPIEDLKFGNGPYESPYKFGAYKLPDEATVWLKKKGGSQAKHHGSSHASSQLNRSQRSRLRSKALQEIIARSGGGNSPMNPMAIKGTEKPQDVG